MTEIADSVSAFRAEIIVDKPAARVFPHQLFFQTVKVRNTSTRIWVSKTQGVFTLSYHWIKADGTMALREGRRTFLPWIVEPGEQVPLRVEVEAPPVPGQYQLEFDIVQEGVAWFGETGSPTPRLPVQVTDELQTFRLKWTGHCTRQEFEAAINKQQWWYHSYHFDNGFDVWGDFDIGRDIQGYGFPDDMTGMSVLDIGAGGGWFAHYFEQRGADVTAVDIRGTCDYDLHGRFAYPLIESEKPGPDRRAPDGKPIYYSRVSQSFWVMKDLLGHKANYVNSRVYDLYPETFGGKKFDLVFIGALLLHLRDPIGALQAARRVCKDRLIATTVILPGMEDLPWPVARMGKNELWWVPTKRCYRQWIEDAGFGHVDVDRAVTLTVDRPPPGQVARVAEPQGSMSLQVGTGRVAP